MLPLVSFPTLGDAVDELLRRFQQLSSLGEAGCEPARTAVNLHRKQCARPPALTTSPYGSQVAWNAQNQRAQAKQMEPLQSSRPSVCLKQAREFVTLRAARPYSGRHLRDARV